MENRALNVKQNAKLKTKQIPGQDKVSPAAVTEAKYLLENFEWAKAKRFHFGRIITKGSFGVSFKMKM
ncbi:hypothetical protein DL764_006653 [Monosporascus ibericus]|uniref:Uncharacterized protein n=1 Tax=Monosporascus ibericus TaxID=155417 RepID=A0A4Q4T480_9PEZI|nr:hypothetical protein DL764_006653 [Monosporascus ibericus]